MSRCTASIAAALVLAFTSAAIAQKGRGSPILPGANSNKPISIEAGKLDYFDKEQKLVYTGDVVATQGDATLKASVLTILLAPKAAGSSAGGAPSSGQVQRMLATGPVTIIQRDQVGTGENGVYDKVANKVVLTGNVRLSRGSDITEGDKLVYDLKSGQAAVSGGRVRSMFTPSSNSGAADDPSAKKTGGKSRGM